MQLNSFFPTNRVLVIKDALGNDTAFKVTLGASNSKAYIAVGRENFKLLAGKDITNDLEVFEECKARLLTSAVLGWEGLTDDEDKPITFTKELAFQLMSTPELDFIQDQIEAAVAERAKFFPGTTNPT